VWPYSQCPESACFSTDERPNNDHSLHRSFDSRVPIQVLALSSFCSKETPLQGASKGSNPLNGAKSASLKDRTQKAINRIDLGTLALILL